jgi:TonB family protein
MVLRSTSPNVAEGRGPQNVDLIQAREHDRRSDEASPRLIAPSAVGSRDNHSPKRVVATDLALDLVLQEIVQHARLATNATGAFIGLVRARKIDYHATSGSTAPEFVAYLDRDRRMVDSCLRSTIPQRYRDSETSEQIDGNACRNVGARSVVMVPILDETDERLGVVGVFSPQIDAFSAANIAALQGLSRRVADAIAQVDRCTSVSSGDASVPHQPDPNMFFIHGLRETLGPIAAALRGSAVLRTRSVWISCIVAVVLLAGWILSRVIGQGAMHTSEKAAVAVTAHEGPSPAAHPLSDHAAANPGTATATSVVQSPAIAAASGASVKPERHPVTASVKSATDARVSHKARKKIPARSELQAPDLEIENALDDASSGSLASEPLGTSKAADPSTDSVPRSGEDKNAASKTAGSMSASPVLIPQRTALARVAERVEPEYPAEAKAQHVQGTVTVDVIVGRDGQVEGVSPVDGDSRLLASATTAVRKWRFTPLVRNGHAVSFESHITLHFALP